MDKRLIIGILVVLALLAVGAITYGFLTKVELERVKNELTNFRRMPNDELKAILDEVGKLMVLPSDELPTLATVTNVEELRKTQPFFNNAKNGNKVLIYTKAKKAILYDPVANKVIDVAPVNIPTPGPTGEASPAPLPSATVSGSPAYRTLTSPTPTKKITPTPTIKSFPTPTP